MRDAINRDEEELLVKAVASGKTWDEVRGMLVGVDPEALDRGFRERVLRAAGVTLEAATDPVLVDEPEKHRKPEKHVRRKG